MKISIVTPCFDAAETLQATIESVAGQAGTPDVEHIVVDGGSTDATRAVIERNADRLSDWISEPDEGMYDAIAKGFERSSGEICAWLNADDVYFPWTLSLVARVFAALPEVDWISSRHPVAIDDAGDVVSLRTIPGFSAAAFLDGIYVGMGGLDNPRAADFIQQESTFWRRGLWDKAGGAETIRRYRYAGDFALWGAFFRHAELYGVDAPLAGFRERPGQLSDTGAEAYRDEARAALAAAREAAGHRLDLPPDGQPAQYQGRDVVKSNGTWEVREAAFVALPPGPLKDGVRTESMF